MKYDGKYSKTYLKQAVASFDKMAKKIRRGKLKIESSTCLLCNRPCGQTLEEIDRHFKEEHRYKTGLKARSCKLSTHVIARDKSNNPLEFRFFY